MAATAAALGSHSDPADLKPHALPHSCAYSAPFPCSFVPCEPRGECTGQSGSQAARAACRDARLTPPNAAPPLGYPCSRSPDFWPLALPPAPRCAPGRLGSTQLCSCQLLVSWCVCSKSPRAVRYSCPAAQPLKPPALPVAAPPRLQMELVDCSVAMFPGEWCTPQLAKAAAFAIEQAAASGTTVAVGSTIQMLGVVMEVPITSSSAAKNSSGACSTESAACLGHAGMGHVG